MSSLEIALLALAALAAGTVDAIAGGGGLVTLPALLAAHVSPLAALATNKGQSVFGSGAALVAFWRAGRVDRKQARFAFPLAFAGSLAGVAAVSRISNDALRPIVLVLLVAAAALLVVKKPTRGPELERGGLAPTRGNATPVPHWGVAAGLALLLGAYDGFFGPGVGTFLIVGFVALCGRSLVHASADAKVVNFASNLAAVAAFAYAGEVRWEIALPMAVGQLVGGVLGAHLAIKGGARVVRVLVLVVSGALVAKLAYQLATGS
ncbi:MAG TPA: TSUP family transporter [Kofleriaceae bacterium]|nr:TSUP family transporter [Kofleriaceae bacterium]